jgi:hypothetical protein
MAEQKDVARGQSSSKRTKKQRTDRDPAANGQEEAVGIDEKQLAGYLQDRIKPGLNRGSIPLLARAIAKEIARDAYRNGKSDASDEPSAEADDERGAAMDDEAEADDEPSAEADDETEADDERSAEDDETEADDEPSDEGPDLETALRDLQAELGSDWILYFSVQGERTWLTAEKDDATQRVEAPSAAVLTKAVNVLNEGGGRSRRRASEAS